MYEAYPSNNVECSIFASCWPSDKKTCLTKRSILHHKLVSLVTEN
jgi:hypothetical protein